MPPGTILLSTRASIGDASIALIEVTTNQGFQSIIPSQKIKSEFLFYLTQSYNFKKEIFRRSSKSTFLEISHSQISKISVNIPNSIEQQKISEFLDLLDKKIELLNDRIEALKKYKEGLFKLHFEELTKKYLKEILTECTIKTKVNNEFKILSSTSNGLFLQNDFFNHQVASENNIGYKVIELGQLIFSPQNLWLGNINLNDKFQRGIVSPSYKIFSISDSINKQRLIGTLKTSKMKYEYSLVSERGASVVRRNLNVKEFMNIKISIPKQQEQLGNISSYLIQKIDILEAFLKNINSLKIYLLKELFI